MVASGHGQVSRITDPLWGEYIGGFTSQKASDAELWFSFSCQLEQAVERTIDMSVIWYDTLMG